MATIGPLGSTWPNLTNTSVFSNQRSSQQDPFLSLYTRRPTTRNRDNDLQRKIRQYNGGYTHNEANTHSNTLDEPRPSTQSSPLSVSNSHRSYGSSRSTQYPAEYQLHICTTTSSLLPSTLYPVTEKPHWFTNKVALSLPASGFVVDFEHMSTPLTAIHRSQEKRWNRDKMVAEIMATKHKEWIALQSERMRLESVLTSRNVSRNSSRPTTSTGYAIFRDLLLSFVQSSTCLLFSEATIDVTVGDADLEALIKSGGPQIIMDNKGQKQRAFLVYLKQMNALGQRYNSFEELLAGLKEFRIQEQKKRPISAMSNTSNKSARTAKTSPTKSQTTPSSTVEKKALTSRPQSTTKSKSTNNNNASTDKSRTTSKPHSPVTQLVYEAAPQSSLATVSDTIKSARKEDKDRGINEETTKIPDEQKDGTLTQPQPAQATTSPKHVATPIVDTNTQQTPPTITATLSPQTAIPLKEMTSSTDAAADVASLTQTPNVKKAVEAIEAVIKSNASGAVSPAKKSKRNSTTNKTNEMIPQPAVVAATATVATAASQTPTSSLPNKPAAGTATTANEEKRVDNQKIDTVVNKKPPVVVVEKRNDPVVHQLTGGKLNVDQLMNKLAALEDRGTGSHFTLRDDGPSEFADPSGGDAELML